jgi:hypothetical protein
VLKQAAHPCEKSDIFETTALQFFVAGVKSLGSKRFPDESTSRTTDWQVVYRSHRLTF